MSRLHSQPTFRSPADPLFQPDRHVGGDRAFAAKNAIELLARDVQSNGGVGDRKAESLNIVLQPSARVGGIFHRHDTLFPYSVVVDEIDVICLAVLETEDNPPI